MEYLADLVTTVPEGTTPAKVVLHRPSRSLKLKRMEKRR